MNVAIQCTHCGMWSVRVLNQLEIYRYSCFYCHKKKTGTLLPSKSNFNFKIMDTQEDCRDYCRTKNEQL